MSEKYPIASMITALSGDLKYDCMISEIIPASKAQGQQDVVTTAKLPKQGDWEVLKRWGVYPGQETDDLFFLSVFLPRGWSKTATDHKMWSQLLDARGLVRANIFYQADFYIREAFFRICDRFQLSKDYDISDGWTYRVVDAGQKYKVVRSFTHCQYALCDEYPNIVGVARGNTFYFDPCGDYSKDTKFSKSCISQAINLISNKRFYHEFHEEFVLYDVIDAGKNLAKEEALEFLATLPQNDDAWAYDWEKEIC